MQRDNTTHTYRISWPIAGAGGSLGLLLSWGVLSGNTQGQVNVLYLLLVYLVIPVASVLLSMLSLILGKGINLARVTTSLPLWSRQNQRFFHKIRQRKLDKQWFFLQSQAAALAFSCASLLVFLLLLLATDVNFVWRSTLLTAESLLPFLQWVASPWQFWQEAQPNLALLQATQDSRLQAASGDVSVFSQWWPFILATQVCYCLLLRGALFVIARIWFQRCEKQDIEKQFEHAIKQHTNVQPSTTGLAPITDHVPGNIMVTNWAGVNETLLKQLDELLLSGQRQLQAGPLASHEAQQKAEHWPDKQLLIVKAWEPPMGDLADYMQKTQGYLLPLDWQNEQLRPPQKHHLEEWRHFVNRLTGWQLYQPPALSIKE